MNKRTTLVTLVLACLAISSCLAKEFSMKEDQHGREYLHHQDAFTNAIHHIVDAGRKKVEITLERYKGLLDTLVALKDPKSALRDTPIIECQPSHPDFFKGFANSVAKVTKEFEKVAGSSYCFKNTRFYWISDSDTMITFYIATYDKVHPQCSDTYLLTTGRNYHFAEVLTTGVHKVSFKNLSQFELDFIL
jgi:hypothetical protein